MSPAEQLDALKPSIDFLARRLVGPAFPYIDRRDLEQDAIVAILERADRFDEKFAPSTFHGARIHGAMVDGLRRWDNRRNGRTRIEWSSLTDLPLGSLRTEASSVETELIAAERAAAVRDAIAQLPPAERYVIRRHFIEGASYAKIAVELDRTKGRVFQLQRSGIDHLRAQFREAA